MLEWTGERYLPYIDPSICGAEIHYEHLHRYAFASQYVKNKKVLDLASGEGFGTDILAKTAECIVGIDINHEVIVHASTKYNKKNISFIQGSILNIPIEGQKIFDVIVCFEAIEHIDEHDILFQEIKRLLKDDGILIISTPNKKTYSDDVNYKNPYHQKELYYSEFCELLKKNFHYIYLHGQQVVSGSSIYPVSSQEMIATVSEFDIEYVRNQFCFSNEDEKLPKYFVAIASNAKSDAKGIQKSYLIDKSNTEIVRLNIQIGHCNTSIQSLDQELSYRDAHLQDANKKIQFLTSAVNLKEQQLQEINNHIESLTSTVSMKEQQLQEINNHVESLTSAVSMKEQQLQKQIACIKNLEQKISSMENSIIWQFTMKFHNKIIERLLPQNSRRRKYYDLGLKGGKILVNKGWDSFWWQFNERRSQKNLFIREKKCKSETIVPFHQTNDITNIETTVSIIIPTKNAGPEFDYVLNKIRSQKGIKRLEIVIVDSGSNDNTLEIAKKYHATIIQIKPEEFDHGKTRNLGAFQSTGEYIFFTTQDALFAGDSLIYTMINFFHNDDKIAAVTCRQVPRSDADLMACYQVWSHYYKFLNIYSDKIVSTNNLKISPHEKRKMANLSDSCCCLKRELFLQYQYKVNFAEDLELGLRLLKDNYKLAYLYNAAIIHSHNRTAAYFFKANYTDSKLVSQILGNPPLDWNVERMGDFFEAIKQIYSKLSYALTILQQSKTQDPMDFIKSLEKEMRRNTLPSDCSRYTDKTIDALFIEIEGILMGDADHKFDPRLMDILINNFINGLDAFGEYCGNYKIIGEINIDFIATIFKIFASSNAASLGNFELYLEISHKIDNDGVILDEFLRKGV